jgi:ABC-type branched-subunit amino acid transport system permease subunit
MHLEIQLVIASIGAAGAVAMLACGLVVIYRGSGVLNFAHGANATAASYVYLWLWNEQKWNAVPAAIAGILTAMIIGTLFQVLVLARISKASVLMRTVATLGLMLTVQGAISPIFGTGGFAGAPRLFGSTTWTLPFGAPGFQLESTRLGVFLLAVGMTVALWALFRFSRFGLVTTGIAENPTALSLLGWPVPRLQTVNWVIGSATAGFAGVFLASLVPITPDYFTQALIVALAAAVVGRFMNFWTTLVAAALIALVQPIIALHDGQLLDLTSLRGWDQVVPFLIIIIVLLRQGSIVPTRATAAAIRLPVVSLPKSPALWVAIVTPIFLVLIFIAPLGMVGAISATLIYALVCLSVVIVTGLTGQISLAQMAFAGFSAFVTAWVSVEVGIPFPLPIIIGTLSVVPLGLIVGIPALRVRGVSLAVLTLAFAVMLQNLIFQNPTVNGSDVGRFLESPSVFGLSLNPLINGRALAVCFLVVVMGAFYATLKFATSAAGRRMIAIRNSERATASAGISVRNVKLLAFAVAAALAGLAGSLLTYLNLLVSYDRFNVLASILVLAMVAIGGLASASGAMIGAIMLPGALSTYILNQLWGGEWQAVVGGVLLIITVILNQNGIAPETMRAVKTLLRRRRSGQAPHDAKSSGAATDQMPQTAGQRSAPPVNAQGGRSRIGG